MRKKQVKMRFLGIVTFKSCLSVLLIIIVIKMLFKSNRLYNYQKLKENGEILGDGNVW